MSVLIQKSDINAALRPSPWDLGNRVLYRLCEDHPKHTDPGIVISKIWLIGRAYAAAIERRKEAKHASDDFYESVVGRKLTSPKIDKWLTSLPITDPWEDLVLCVKVHKRLMDMFSRMTGLDKRSLASKYLHFHRPDLFSFTTVGHAKKSRRSRRESPAFLVFRRRYTTKNTGHSAAALNGSGNTFASGSRWV